MKSPGFWRLLGAYIVDFLFISVIGVVLEYLVMWVLALGYIVMLRSGGNWIIVVGVGTFISSVLLYFSICESVWGKTLGKRLMGMQVVQQDPAQNK
ncbi:MAG: RDD family protein [Elusimicrobiaceae bacterium]|nr:RDD family protein [Elusimicrobiaceae bacterium]